jgi:hypothetical protein
MTIPAFLSVDVEPDGFQLDRRATRSQNRLTGCQGTLG